MEFHSSTSPQPQTIQHSIDLRPFESQARSRVIEVVIIVLMGLMMFGVAFLAFNQALILERINNNQTMLKTLHEEQRRNTTPMTVAQAPVATPTPAVIATPVPAPVVTPEPIQPEPVKPLVVLTPPRETTRPAPQPEPTPTAPLAPTPVAITPPLAPTPTETTSSPAPTQTPATTAETSAEAKDTAIWDRHQTTVIGTIQDLYGGRYDDVFRRFTLDYAQRLSKNTLANVMDTDRGRYGNFRQILGHQIDRTVDLENQHVFKITVDTDQDRLILFTITVTPEDQISSLFYRPIKTGV